MAISSDVGAIMIGAALGYGLRKEIKATGNVCRNALLSAVAGAAATAATQMYDQTTQQGQSTNGGNQNGH